MQDKGMILRVIVCRIHVQDQRATDILVKVRVDKS
jgi:hypothetical protein